MVGFKNDLSTPAGLAELNDYLLTRSYISGYMPSAADNQVFKQVPSDVDSQKFPNVARWQSHIASFTRQERAKWGGGNVEFAEHKAAPAAAAAAAPGGPKPAASPAKPAPAPAPAASKSNDDDFSLDDDDPAAASAAAAAAAQKKKELEEKKKKEEEDAKKKEKKKEPVIAKSTVIFDVKPEGSDTDMAQLEKNVRAIEMDGLRWAGSELVPVAFGVKKLRIISVVVDDVVSVDELQEKIEALADCQSVDIFAFNKV